MVADVHVSLIGGGWTADAAPLVYGSFLGAARRGARGAPPRIACVVIDEGDGLDYFERFATALTSVSRCDPYPVLIPVGGSLDVARLDVAHGLLVCGGGTPAYADALSPHREQLRRSVSERRIAYAGFSAGASVAARYALVGGWRHRGIPVCPEEASEDLDDVTIVAGLGLVDQTVEVHAAQWGTLARLRAALSRMPPASTGLAIDEDTVAVVDNHRVRVDGTGKVTALRVGLSGRVDEVDLGDIRQQGPGV